jgi:hypothetical protein
MKKMNYTTVEELLVSDGFLKWYRQKDEKEVRTWNEWIAENPEHQRLANEAVQMLELIRSVQEKEITDQEFRISSNRLINAIQNNEKLKSV